MLDAILAASETFGDLSPQRLRSLASHCAEIPVAEGRLVFAHGEAADAVYLVLEGTVTIFRDKVGRAMQLLARIGPGELLGELCLFDETTRTASARTATACRLLRLAREPLLEVLRAEPQLAVRIQNTAARRRNLNSAAALELGQQSEVRIRLRAPVRVRLDGGRVISAQLGNLSVGGLSLEGVPDDWAAGTTARFELLVDGEVLRVDGRIAWRHDGAVGIAFMRREAGHERLVYRLLRRLAEGG